RCSRCRSSPQACTWRRFRGGARLAGFFLRAGGRRNDEPPFGDAELAAQAVAVRLDRARGDAELGRVAGWREARRAARAALACGSRSRLRRVAGWGWFRRFAWPP